MTARDDRFPPYRCPACRGAVTSSPDAYGCEPCGLRFPILFGIPDFRLRSDRYLSLAEERGKAQRLHDFAEAHSFEDLVRYYYEITDDVTPDRAVLYAAYVTGAEYRAGPILAELGPFAPDAVVLDCGCGGGGLVAAAARQDLAVVGVDIALRWLVIAQKRLQSLGLSARLVCADAEAPPFADAGFSHVVASDVLEHAYEPAVMLTRMAALLRPGGTLWLSASNRFWLGPHPSVGLWAAGLRPPWLRRRGGYDVLRHVALLSPPAIARSCRTAGLELIRHGPKTIEPQALAGRGGLVQAFGRTYARLCAIPGIRRLLFVAGPAFEVVARRQGRGSPSAADQSSRLRQSPSPKT